MNRLAREADEKRQLEVNDSFSSLTISSRAFNGVVFALAGAILAGIAQLAGNQLLASVSDALRLTTLVAAFGSVLFGAFFLVGTLTLSSCRFKLKHGERREWEQEELAKVPEPRRPRLIKCANIAESVVMPALVGQMTAWLASASAYAAILCQVSSN